MAGLISRARPLALTLCVAAATVVPGSAPHAAPLALADVPLFLATDVPPNLIMAIDDSSSMDGEVLLPTNDGAAWWRVRQVGGCPIADSSGNNSFVGCGASPTDDVAEAGKLNFNYTGIAGVIPGTPGNAATWKKFVYLFPNHAVTGSTTTDRRRLADSTHDHYAIPPIPSLAWARSPVYNSLYFNPNVVYQPWTNADGSPMASATATAARFDPKFNPPNPATLYTPTMDLTKFFAGTTSSGTSPNASACTNANWQVQDNYYFRVFRGMQIPEGTCIRRITDSEWGIVQTVGGCSVGAAAACDTSQLTPANDYPIGNNTQVAIRYWPATFYLGSAIALPADYGYTATPLVGQAPDGSELKGYEIKPGNFSDTAHYNAALQNFANWFTYHRKRHQVLRAGLGKAFKDITKMRVGGFTINLASAGTAPDVSLADIDGGAAGANRAALYSNFYNDWTGNGGTPNRQAVANIIRNFKRDSGNNQPIQHACQKNFGMLFTDGFSNTSTIFGNANSDGGLGDPFQDSVGGTMADGVMRGYLDNLRPPPNMPAGKVPVPSACDAANPDSSLDCNRNLHMNFYAITLDSRGVLFNPDVPIDPFENPPLWPTTFQDRHPSAVDDLWHATINGRGLMLNARGADEVAERLGEVLRNIVERTSSASAAAVNSGIISSETRVYQARFNTRHWTGQLLSFSVDEQTGEVEEDTDWDASEQLPAFGSRKIFTVNETNAAVPFAAGSLSDVRKRQVTGTLAGDPVPADTLVGNHVDFIRGKDVAGFRERPSKLGDIISSAPLYVGGPRGRYSDTLGANDAGNETAYSTFAKAKKDRTPMIYVGANDGMLHAIDAESGAEKWAFVPGAVFGNLVELTKPSYTHRYYVDGAPNVGDAYFSGGWHSVLVGGLNKGGRSIYALDVTDPAAADETAAAGKFLWEFQHADLGYSYSQPAVVRLHDGQWAAVFGNGYNNTGSGTAVLYVVNIKTGALIKKFDTGVGITAEVTTPNGMATPVLVDVDGDRVVDHAYAGDLRGNLWKIDLNGTGSSDWDFAFEDGSTPQPLFTAKAPDGTPQPITTRPEVARGPFGAGVIVLFGTGKYLETTDNTVVGTQPKQSFYGLVDANTHTADDRIEARSELRPQTITQQTFNPGAIPVRTVTDDQLTDGQHGWYMDLPINGERQITDPVVRSDRVIFTTLIPTSDACSFGGTSWLMEVDLLNGGALPSAPLDTNGDGKVDEADLLPDGSVPSGLMAEEYLSRPAILTTLYGDGPDRKISSGSSGGLPSWAESADHGGRGRQSWRQIR